MKLQKTVLTAVAASVLALSSLAGPTNAAPKNNQGQAGGAAGLVAAVVQVAANDTVEVNVVDTLNNLTAVQNVLNNSPILSGNDVDVNVGDISLLDGLDVDLLNGLNVDLNALGIDLDDVTGVALVTRDGVTDVLVLI